MGKNGISKESVIQFIKFGFVGLSNAAIGLGTYYFFLWLSWHYMAANVLSWVISVFNAFFWNSRYVFKTGNSWLTALFRTYVSYGFSFVLGAVALYILVEFCSISKVIAPVLVLVITTPVNYLLNKFWTFR